MWGPEAYTDALAEPYAESPWLARTVQYFDKSRMEITDPNADPNTALVCQQRHLLATELISGRLQLGDTTFDQHDPAAINVGGDANDPTRLTMPRWPWSALGGAVRRRGDYPRIDDRRQLNDPISPPTAFRCVSCPYAGTIIRSLRRSGTSRTQRPV
jgi:hypothetical protein